ncbi:conserved virulence factor C family protein [Solibacillus sp. FSL H8-0538]|uniref:conserved virulence factor C family protein n=1 Tax=Solibacillus sp. FSL H8-0538 TaxID=2921400 RepID=UPI0030FC7AE3
MKIITIEPTPSPNSMKIVIDQDLPFGKSFNYTKENIAEASATLQAIFAVEGVKGIYHVSNFLAVERNGKFSWETILSGIRHVLGENNKRHEAVAQVNEHFGEVNVHVQIYKGVPLQIKAFDGEGEVRIATGDRFKEAFNAIQTQSADENYIFQRQWMDFGIRYGDKDKVAIDVKAEVVALYPDERVQRILEVANKQVNTVTEERQAVTIEQFQVEDWQQRFQLLDRLPDPEVTDIPLLTLALDDEQMAIRRLATVYLGMIEDVAVVPALEKALADKSAAVRRTAGDCMSDLGLAEFEPAMIKALVDKNKLIRWRAAMYLYESGTEAAVDALRIAAEDAEFEVKLQAKMALARIEQGEQAKGSVWKQMTDARTHE